MSKVALNTKQSALYTAELFQQDIDQKLLKMALNTPNLFISEQNWYNGIKTFIAVALPDGATFDPKTALVIGDFNATNNKLYAVKYSANQKDYYKLMIPSLELMNAFSTEATKKAFVDERLDSMRKRISYTSFIRKATLLAGKATLGLTITPDKIIDIKGYTDDQNIESIINTLKTLETPSHTHTKFGSTAGNENFIYSAKRSDLVWVRNLKYATKLSNIRSKVFNLAEITQNVQSVDIDFDLIPGLTAAQKKIRAVIFDRRAIVEGMGFNLSQTTLLPKFRTLYEMALWVGFARLDVYPIIKFIDST